MTEQPVAGSGSTLKSNAALIVCLNYSRKYAGLMATLLLYLGLALSYFFIVPIFEAPDEWTHTGHIKHIAEGNGLPVMPPGQGIWGGQQPPLYYAIGAILVQPFELDELDRYLELRRNPHASVGYALDPGNKNNYLHSSQENFPFRGLSLTVHVLRLYSIIFGLITLIFVYFTALELARPTAPRPQFFAAAAALLVACQPMFAFITASVANEPANMAFSAISLWLAQRYVLNGPSRSCWRAVGLGVSLGLVSLSKMTGLSIGLVIVVAILQAALATRKQPGAARLLWRDCLIIGLMFLLVGGWWYWRNYRLYGDFFQRGLYQIYFNELPQPLSLREFLFTLSTGEVSFWATFGWLNIVAPDWVYRVYRLVSRVGLLGVGLVGVIRLAELVTRRLSSGDHANKKPGAGSSPLNFRLSALFRIPTNVPAPLSTLPIHLVFPVALAFSLTRLVATEGGLQGRQLLPALGSIAIVIVWGWWSLLPGRIRRPVLSLLIAVLVGLAIWLPARIVAPEYLARPSLSEAELPANHARIDLSYNDELKLLGARIEARSVQPGQRVPVTVYWQALQSIDRNYSVFVHLIGRNYQNVGQLNTYPGLGLHPTSELEPGQIIVDTYPVQVNDDAEAPARLLVNVGIFDINEDGRPGKPAIAPDGSEVAPTVGSLKLIPGTWPQPQPQTPLAVFSDHIWLNDARFSGCTRAVDDCLILLEWLAQDRPSAEYTVFIQLWQDGSKVTGFDAPPLANNYPTSLWETQEVILDPHRLDLSSVPPGTYQVLAGLYQFDTGQRLPAAAGGAALPDNAVKIGVIELN